jgi:predicted dehydrogenase
MMNGEKGTLEMNPGFGYDGPHLQGFAGGRRIDEQSTGKHPYVFALEADHFSHCVRTDTMPKSPGEEGHKDMIAIEAIYKAAGRPIA